VQRHQLAAQCTKILRIKVRHVGLARNSVILEDRRCHREAFAFQELLPYIVMRSHDADRRPVRRRLAPCTVSELPVRFRGCWRVRAHARPGSRARGTRDRTIGTLADPFERAARGARCAECSSCPGADAGGRAPAKPRALTPTRPRVRVPALSVLAPGCVRRRGCSRTPSLNRARAPALLRDKVRTGIFANRFFFPALTVGHGHGLGLSLRLPVRVPGKKLTDRRRWPAVTQHEVLILTRDIMSLQRYRPKSACYWCLSSYD